MTYDKLTILHDLFTRELSCTQYLAKIRDCYYVTFRDDTDATLTLLYRAFNLANAKALKGF